ncbi:MAG: hypothetical protein LBV30_01840 [Propionibacteriaceae bacterium]|jgi:hypothetical protein|nr:hypothetical protein [Propionibacteriaceae bacterium]
MADHILKVLVLVGLVFLLTGWLRQNWQSRQIWREVLLEVPTADSPADLNA